MKDEEKKKDQLTNELLELRQHIAELAADDGDGKSAEEAPREREELLKTLFEYAPDAYYVTDMHGNFVNCNRATEKITGYKSQELIGKNILTSKFLSSNQISKAAEILARNELGNPTGPDEFFLNRKDGTQVAVEIRTCPARIKEQVLVLNIARDIAVRKRAEEALQRVRDDLEERLEDRTAGLSSVNELLNIEISERKKAEEALQSVRLELEERLEERTVELSNANAQLIQEISERKKAEDGLQRVREDLEERLEERTADLSNVNELLKKEISERKQAEEAQKDGDKKILAILETIEDGYYETDIAGNLTSFSDSFCKILGFPRDELVGMNNREFMDEENARKIYQTFNKVYTSGEPAKAFDWEIIRQDGAVRSIEASASLMKDLEGHRVGFRGIVRDITERKQMESEKNLLQDIFESSLDCIATTDLHGYTQFASPKVQEVLGYEQNEIIGKKIHFLYANEIDDAKRIMKALTAKGELKNHEMKLRKKDGKLLDISLSASFLRNGNSEVIGTLGIFRDITDKKRLDAQLKEAGKMEAIETLAGGIAHDFNNLLMGMQGNASLMLLDINSSHPHYEKLKNIEQHVQSGADLTKQLLGFAGGGKYDVKPTNLNDIIKETSDLFGRTKEEINIHTNYQENIWTVSADQGQIKQVLSNLYNNAWEAMPSGGDLYLETENVILNETYYVESYGMEPGKYVKISITDTGVGMDEATKERVFEPFFTTKEMGRGKGLGLASSYGIIRNHGGIINVHSKKGKGTTFNIYLPVAGKGATG
jgi:two-component system cell cycle sensor histidine kinase/response regulator CckA